MNRYNVICDRKYLDYISKKKIRNLKIENDKLVFECNDIKQFQEIDLEEVIDNKPKVIKNIISKYLITILGLFLFILLLLPLTKTVTEIKFTNEETYNEEVYQYVNSRIKKVWVFAFLDDDITQINKDIRSKFYDYQWINIEKDGTKVLINITNDNSLITDDLREEPKSLYSKYDSIVEGYYVEKGTITVKVGHSVSKGDLLIDGHVKMYNEKSEEVTAKGYVYGKVIETQKISVLKKEEIINRTGKVESHNIYILFGNSLNNPVPKFSDYETEYQDLYSFGNSIAVKKVIYYEISGNTLEYTKNEAIEYGKSLIEKEFKKNKKYDFEDILEIKILSINETDYDYEITYQIKSVKDLCN